MSERGNQIVNNSQSTDCSLIEREKFIVKVNSVNYIADQIREELVKITDSFFNLGMHLYELKGAWNEELLQKDFYLFCEEQFNLKSTSVKNFINVYKSFKSEDDPRYIDSKFENTSFSALVELLPIKDDKEVAAQIKNLSTRQIREIVKVYDVNPDAEFEENVFGILINLLSKKGLEVTSWKTEQDNYWFKIVDGDLVITYRFIVHDDAHDDNRVFEVTRDYTSYNYTWFYKYFGIGIINELIEAIFQDFSSLKISFNERNNEEDDSDEEEEEFVPSGFTKKLGLISKDDIFKFVKDVKNYVNITSSEFDKFGLRVYFLDPIECPEMKEYIKMFFYSYSNGDGLFFDNLEEIFTYGGKQDQVYLFEDEIIELFQKGNGKD